MEERNWGTGIIGESEELVQKLWGEKKKKEVMAKGTILGDEENKLFPCGQPTEIEHGERHWRDKRFIQRLCLYSLSFSHVFRNCSLLQRANRENSLWVISFFTGLLWLFSSDSYDYIVCLQPIVFRLKYRSSPESVFDSTFTR